jgi:hypothetical protein
LVKCRKTRVFRRFAFPVASYCESLQGVAVTTENTVTTTTSGQTATQTGQTSGQTGQVGETTTVTKKVIAHSDTVAKLTWSGTVPHQKWMNFYTKVLSKFAGGKGLNLTISVEAVPEGGISNQKVEETKVALRELGLDDDVATS